MANDRTPNKGLIHAGPSCLTGPALRSAQKHSLFYWEFVEFQVQDVLFQLPLLPFVEGSKTFAAAHGLVPRDDESNPGTKDQRTPVKLDVGLREFEAFLKVLLSLAQSLEKFYSGMVFCTFLFPDCSRTF
ncbi:hypothetical protein BKA70DRAFT_1286124 [Coprinopsis sp. MPI-PUGE-AT-0042]|nr:hypothetical protein BKA70DRAFT_1286124 [Coprinopsis sp. MPI-PUGE-AT-0042]